MSVKQLNLGGLQLNFSDSPEVVTQKQSEMVTDFLTEKYVPTVMPMYSRDYRDQHTLAMSRFGVPSFCVRLDMPPMNGSWPGIFEVEAGPAGLGVADEFGLPTTEKIAEKLHDFGITKVRFGAGSSRKHQQYELEIFAKALRKREIDASFHEIDAVPNTDEAVWLRAGQEDVDQIGHLLGRCLLMHLDGGGHKDYLCDVDSATALSGFADPLNDPFEKYPKGFVLKPRGSWGCQDVQIWSSEKPWKEKGVTRSRMTRAISQVVQENLESQYLVQDFARPYCRINDDNDVIKSTHLFKIWRLYAIWTGEKYQPIGGFWAERPSLMVHGASDCVNGLLLVE